MLMIQTLTTRVRVSSIVRLEQAYFGVGPTNYTTRSSNGRSSRGGDSDGNSGRGGSMWAGQ